MAELQGAPKPPRIIVTGVNGFVGRHLAAELGSSGATIIGIGTESSPAVEVEEYVSADLSQGWPSITNVDAIIHLAGLASVGESFDQPQRYLDVNGSIVTHLCEAMIGSAARIVLVSSGSVYDATGPLPLTENSSLTISSPYAMSKVLNESQAAYYRARGLDCVVARPFNHIGPGQHSGFLLPDLWQSLTEKPTAHALKTGDLSTRRDYTDVRDVASAYRLLATAPRLSHDVYNICSGNSRSGRDILSVLLKVADLDDIETITDKSRLRPADSANIVGDCSRLHNDTGWLPSIPIERTVADFLAALEWA